MTRAIMISIGLAWLGLCASPAIAQPLAAPSNVLVTLPNRDAINPPTVRSFAAMRFDGIVRQTHDLSCGAAAMATLLASYFGIKISEEKVIESILSTATPEDKAKIAEGGFSMLELKRAAERAGLIAGGFRANKPEELRNLKAPAIVLVTNRGYSHFVVVRRVVGNDVFIADPAFGNRVEPISKFASGWNKVFLIAVHPQQLALPASQLQIMQAFRNASPQGQDERGLQLALSRAAGVPFEQIAGEY